MDDVPERFVPEEMHGQLVEAEHVARYRWAAGFCASRRVLDAGCGLGYGSDLIGRAGASEVFGVDISEATIELAQAASPGVVFDVGDVVALPYEDDAFDVVVCFEVIEHVDDPDGVLDELGRVLRPDGLLLLSSPNRVRYVPGNPHHRHEYIRSELQAALDARFPAARVISQHVMVASVINWSGTPVFEDAETHRVSEPQPEDEIYLLAMAGSELPPDLGQVVTLGRFAEPRRWLEHIDRQQRHAEKLAQRIEDLEAAEDDRRSALERLAEAERELATVRARRTELDEARRELDELRAEVVPLRTVVASKSWRMTGPLRRLAIEMRRHT